MGRVYVCARRGPASGLGWPSCAGLVPLELGGWTAGSSRGQQVGGGGSLLLRAAETPLDVAVKGEYICWRVTAILFGTCFPYFVNG